MSLEEKTEELDDDDEEMPELDEEQPRARQCDDAEDSELRE